MSALETVECHGGGKNGEHCGCYEAAGRCCYCEHRPPAGPVDTEERREPTMADFRAGRALLTQGPPLAFVWPEPVGERPEGVTPPRRRDDGMPLTPYDAKRFECEQLTRQLREAHVVLASTRAERDRYREHSITLNTISWRIASALGDVPEGAEQVEGDPVEQADRLIAERDEACAEVKAVRWTLVRVRATLAEVLGGFHERGHPGYEALRSRWVAVETIKRWRAVLAEPARESPREHPEAVCGFCGGPNIVWVAPSPLWNAVMRGGSINGVDRFGGIVCPTCFARPAEEAGIAEDWRLTAQRVHAKLETTTPSGRVWDEQTWLWQEPPVGVHTFPIADGPITAPTGTYTARITDGQAHIQPTTEEQP